MHAVNKHSVRAEENGIELAVILPIEPPTVHNSTNKVTSEHEERVIGKGPKSVLADNG